MQRLDDRFTCQEKEVSALYTHHWLCTGSSITLLPPSGCYLRCVLPTWWKVCATLNFTLYEENFESILDTCTSRQDSSAACQHVLVNL